MILRKNLLNIKNKLTHWRMKLHRKIMIFNDTNRNSLKWIRSQKHQILKNMQIMRDLKTITNSCLIKSLKCWNLTETLENKQLRVFGVWEKLNSAPNKKANCTDKDSEFASYYGHGDGDGFWIWASSKKVSLRGEDSDCEQMEIFSAECLKRAC